MIIEIRDGVKIIRHSTGVVNVYGIAYMQEYKALLQTDVNALQDEVNRTDADLKAMLSSQYPSLLKRIVNKVSRKKG